MTDSICKEMETRKEFSVNYNSLYFGGDSIGFSYFRNEQIFDQINKHSNRSKQAEVMLKSIQKTLPKSC